MSIIKINPLTNDAAAILRSNLEQLGIRYAKPFGGSAFVFDTASYIYGLVFRGLWVGYEANIEDQSNSITHDDLEELRNAG